MSWLRFIYCTMLSPFILPCFPFSLTGEWKGEKSLNELYSLYLLHHASGQIHVWVIASFVKIINKCNVFLCTDSSQQHCNFCAWTNRLTCFSTCSLPVQLLLCVNIIVNKRLTTNMIKYRYTWDNSLDNNYRLAI